MGNGKIVVSIVIVAVAAMMMFGTIMPAMAQPDVELDSHQESKRCQKLADALDKAVNNGRLDPDKALAIFTKVCIDR